MAILTDLKVVGERSNQKYQFYNLYFLTFKVLLVLLTTNPTFSEPISVNKIEFKNWNRFSLENWPKHDIDHGSIGQSKRFYYIQGQAGQFEEGRPFLGLKKDYFHVNDSLLSDSATVSFKYWSNSETTHFHSTTDRSKSVRLNQPNQWTQVQNVQVNQYQWPYYEFYNQDNFTFALKDFRVQYVGNRAPISQITSFKNDKKQHLSSNVAEVDLTKMDISKSGKPIREIIQFAGMFGSMQTHTNLQISKNWKQIQFKLKLRAIKSAFQVQIFNEPREVDSKDVRYKFVSTPSFPKDLETQFEFGFNLEDNNRINISVYPYDGFALWDLRIDESSELIHNFVKEDQFKISGIGELMQSNVCLVNSLDSPAYMNLVIEDDYSEYENCFIVAKSHEQIYLELYLTLEGEAHGRKLSKVTKNLNIFCMSSLIYLRSLGKFQLSFIFTGELIDQEFLFNLNLLKVSLSKTAFKGVDMPGENPTDFKIDYLFNLWLLNGPKLVDDYTTLVSDSSATLYACGILANCFPYERSKNDLNRSDGQTAWNFTLPQQYKALIAHSPVIRFKTSDPNATIFSDTNYFRTNSVSIQRIKSHLTSASPNLKFETQPFQNSIHFHIKVPGQTRIPLEFPILDIIDPRGQTILTEIRPIEGSRKIHLVSMKLNKLNNNHDKVENIRIDSNSSDILTISTGDYILVRPWTMGHDIKSFGFEFEVQVDPNSSDSSMIELKVKISVQNVNHDLIIKEFDDNSIFSMSPSEGWKSFPDDQNIRLTSLNHQTHPRSFTLSKWIPSGSGQLADNFEGSKIHFRFNTLDGSSKFSDLNIQVKRIVIGASHPSYFTLTPLKVHVRDTVASLVDDFKQHDDNSTVLLSGPFRVGYLVELHANVQVNFEFEPIVKKFTQIDKDKNCHLGPTFAELDCLVEPYQCPEYNFNYDPIKKTCTPAVIPQLIEDQCDPSIGCSNIFDRSLPSSSIYSNDAQINQLQNAYFPANEQQLNYIRVSRPVPNSNDFCIQFDYIANHLALKVTDSVTGKDEEVDRNIVSFVHSKSKWLRNQTVCASQLSGDDESKIDAIYLYFDHLENASKHSSNDVEQHMIANLRYVGKMM